MPPGEKFPPIRLKTRIPLPFSGKGASGAGGSRALRLADRASRWIALAAIFLLTVLLITPSLLYRPEQYLDRASAPEDIYASITFSVPDEEKKDEFIREKERNAPYFYEYDASVLPRALSRLDGFLNEAARLGKLRTEQPEEDVAARLNDYSQKNLQQPIESDTAISIISHAENPAIKEAVQDSLNYLYVDRGIIDDFSRYRAYQRESVVEISPAPAEPVSADHLIEPASVQAHLERRYFVQQRYYSTFAPEEIRVILWLARVLAHEPSISFNAQKTKESLADAISDIRKHPPIRVYEKGTVLFDEGRPIDRFLLDQMNDAYSRTFFKRTGAIALYVALLFAVVCYYIKQFKPDLAFNTRNVLLVAAPVLMAIFLGRLIIETVRDNDAAVYAFPAGIIGMLAIILLDARLGIVLVTIGSLAFSIVTNLEFKVFLMALLGGYSAVAALTKVQERRDVIWAGFLVGIVNTVAVMLINFIDNPKSEMMDLFMTGMWGFANGIMCGVITLPALVLFESVFGVVTDVRLLELTGLDHPLLQQLEEKAPGTYQHSLGVSKLAEAAAKAIGANFLLVRAGAYYHDVGKIVKPKYFMENQISNDEKTLHSKLSPYMSAMVVKNHVKAGIDLARQHRLPERVISCIPEHQGTTIISFFYKQAKTRFENSESTDPVREEDFRYPGPKPQSVETAIVMLADSVEATVTSRFTSLTINEDELRHTVQKTISEKFDDGQFDECDLTLRDLHNIRESFIHTLLGRFHRRIDYPAAAAQSGPAGPSPRKERIERVV